MALDYPADFEGWRRGARQALMDGLLLEDIEFRVKGDAPTLFMHQERGPPQAAQTTLRVPKEFPQLAKRAICHCDPERFRLLYALLERLQGERALLGNRADPLVHRVNVLAKEVGRDKHKMTAFVRFRLVEGSQPEHYVAWFEPSHYTLDYTAPFFMRRFTGMHWSIFTPYRSAHWDGAVLSFGAGASKQDVPEDDKLEDYWRTYYAHIFNPARVKLKAMQAEMPKKYWKNLPEAGLIQTLTHESEARTRTMLANAPTLPVVREAAAPAEMPENMTSLHGVRQGLEQCEACELCHGATQVVPGEGLGRAAIMLVGEQPGDQEDLEGRPFVGPAGDVLSRALQEAGLERGGLYITNAVKHFKYTMRGKRRLHQRPEMAEIDACRWWLMQEISLVKPLVIVALGATAHRALTGQSPIISKARLGLAALELGPQLQTSYHPSAILRARDEAEGTSMFAMLVDDLRTASSAAGSSQPVRQRVSGAHVL
ncbi:MAG: UdgX family uracil-DNA binding protein [Pseudomonadota bacterium]